MKLRLEIVIMKPWFLAVLILLQLTAPLLAAGRPMTVDDLLAVKGVSDPQLSPDGSLVVYVVSELDRATDKTNDQSLARPVVRRRAQAIDDRARRPTTTRAGAPTARRSRSFRTAAARSQVWLLPIDGGEPRQLTKLPIDVSGPDLVAQGRQARLHRRGLSRANSRADRRQGQGKGSVQEQGSHLRSPDDPPLEAWDEGKRSHLFVADAQTGEAKDLTPKLEVNTPPAPFGGSSDYAWSPDGKELAFTAEPAQDAAWSTNTDIWTVPVEGGEPKNITAATRAPMPSRPIRPTATGSPSSARPGRDSSRTSGCSRSCDRATRPATS